MSTFLHQLHPGDGLHHCVIEDNGRVAYAYLIRGKQITGDLWLYNQAETPEVPEWDDRTKMPFLNAKPFVNFETMASPLAADEEVGAEWDFSDGGRLAEVRLFVRGQLYGLLAPEAKPGWCLAALKDGPLAKVLLS